MLLSLSLSLSLSLCIICSHRTLHISYFSFNGVVCVNNCAGFWKLPILTFAIIEKKNIDLDDRN